MSNNKEYIIPDQIEDTIQCIKFIPTQNANYLATGGWDNKLRVFNINCNSNYSNDDAQISSNLEKVWHLPCSSLFHDSLSFCHVFPPPLSHPYSPSSTAEVLFR